MTRKPPTTRANTKLRITSILPMVFMFHPFPCPTRTSQAEPARAEARFKRRYFPDGRRGLCRQASALSTSNSPAQYYAREQMGKRGDMKYTTLALFSLA